jgi:origin recognition complex subunit 6
MESIVVPLGKRTEDEWVNNHLTWLLGVLYLFVWKSVNMPEDLDEDRYIKVRHDIVETLRNARASITVKGLDEDETWVGWRDIGDKDLDATLKRVNKQGWLESDWASGIDDLIDSRDGNQPQETESGIFSEHRDSQPQVRKGDTMFQDRYDYLSEKKQNEYFKWKEGILKRIAELERGSQDAMEIDT